MTTLDITYVHVSDAVRWVCVVGSYLMAAFVLRATVSMIRRYGLWTTRYPSPVSGAALVGLFIVGSVRRFDNLGQPGDAYLWAYLGLLALFVIGTTRTVRFDLRPPWRRHDRA